MTETQLIPNDDELPLGAALRRLRVQKGIDLVVVSQHMVMAPEELQALEEATDDEFPMSALVPYVEALGGRVKTEVVFDDSSFRVEAYSSE